MKNYRKFAGKASGVTSPSMGAPAPFSLTTAGALCLLALFAGGCGDDDEKRSLEPMQLGMTNDLAPIYDDGELTLYEVKRSVQFPIVAPTQQQLSDAAARAVAPFPRYPFLTNKQVAVQVSWTVSNLDEETHNVELLVDPWNEFARYVPGLQLVDPDEAEFVPNLSGIDTLFELPGTKGDRDSRRRGTFTFEDMNELATDFATVMNIIANPPATEGEEDTTAGYVNRAFAIRQRSNRDVVTMPFIPGVIPGLTGIDIGLRTENPANIAIEIVVEVVDKDSGKVLEEGSDAKPMTAPTDVVTVGYEGM